MSAVTATAALGVQVKPPVRLLGLLLLSFGIPAAFAMRCRWVPAPRRAGTPLMKSVTVDEK
jgi:hypothetical protein